MKKTISRLTPAGTSSHLGAGTSRLVPQVKRVVPARSKIAVNKSIPATPVVEKKQGEEENLDQIFAKNVEIAVALLPTVAFKSKPFLAVMN